MSDMSGPCLQHADETHIFLPGLLMDVVDKQQGRIPPNSPREKGSDGRDSELDSEQWN